MRPNLPENRRFLFKKAFRELPMLALFTLATYAVAAETPKGSMEPPTERAKPVDYVTGVFEVEAAQSSVSTLAPPAKTERRFKQVEGHVTLARPFTESKAEVKATGSSQIPEVKITSTGFTGTASNFKMNAEVSANGKTEEVVFVGRIADTKRAEGDRFVHQFEMSGPLNPKELGFGTGDQPVILKLKLASALRDQRGQMQTPPTK